MAISSSTRKAGPFLGNDATTVFPFAFKVFTSADLRVVRTNALGVESDLVLDTDYTVALNSNQDNDPGGTVTRGTALPTGERLTITSDVEALQPLVLTNNGGFYPRVINDAFDKITIIAQQLIEQVGRSLKLPISSTASATLPDPVANRLIAWNGSASGFTNVNPADIATVAAYADAYIDLFTGNGTQTAFTLTHDPAVLANLSVSISGVVQVGGEDFTWVGTTLTFVVAPPNGTRIQVRYTRAIPPADLASAVAAAEADRVATAADRVQTGLDVIAAEADRVATAADRVQTGLDRVATAADAVATAADRVQTGLDRVATAADVVATADKVAASALAASTGAALVGRIGVGTGAVAETVQGALRSVVTFEQFGAVGDNSTDDRAAMQLAFNYAVTAGGVEIRGRPGAIYKITTSELIMGRATYLNLNGAQIVQYTNNVPILSVTYGAFNDAWSIENGRIGYNTQQTGAHTSAFGLVLGATNKMSFGYRVKGLRIDGAYIGVYNPASTGCFTFLGSFEDVFTQACVDWGWYISCGPGENTHLTFTNCWAVQAAGMEIAGSKGFFFNGCASSSWLSLSGDHLQNTFVSFQSCSGVWGTLTLESADIALSSGSISLFEFVDANATVDLISLVANNLTTTGSGEIYIVRAVCSVSGSLEIYSYLEKGTAFSGSNIYEVNPTSGMTVTNEVSVASRSVSFADFGITRKVVRWNGIDLMRRHQGGLRTVFGTTPPASEAWVVGDMMINTAPAAGTAKGWVCTTAGTPGTWVDMDSFVQSGTGAVTRTVQARLQDTLSFADFGAVGDDSTDDTAFIAAAITAASALATVAAQMVRVEGVPGKTYKITSTIALANGVNIDLNGSKIKQYTNNTPIVSAPTSIIQRWALRNGTLVYNTAQTTSDTSGFGLRLANTSFSYSFEVANLDVSNAYKAIFCPTTGGSFAFLGSFNNVRAIDAADWGWDIQCDSGTGANTNLAFNNCWAVQTGTPKAESKGFKIKAMSQGRFNSMAVDHSAKEAFNFESCTGEWGCLSVESCDFVGPVNPVAFFDSPGTVQSLKYIDNTYTSTGGDIYMLRPGCNVTGYLQIDSFIESGGVFTGANTYEINPTAGMRIVNNFASTSRSPVFADFGIRRKVVRWNGIDLMRFHGAGQVEVFTTAAPASEAWIVGDIATNTAPAAGGPPGWMCTTAGTPGTWKAMANLAA